MQQLSKARAILYHLYPGFIITLAFIFLAPFVMRYGYPPQLDQRTLIFSVSFLATLHLYHPDPGIATNDIRRL